MTGGKVHFDEMDTKLDFSFFGKSKKIKVAKDVTTIIDGLGNSNDIKDREKQIRFEISNTKSSYDKKRLEERLAKLSYGIALIKVGASTEAEMKEKKLRLEDALNAAKAAAKGGILPGGGVALIRAVKSLEDIKFENEDEELGFEIVKKASFAPAITIANNAGKNGEHVVEKILETRGSWGYNALLDKFSDLLKDGVIDPLLVTKTALKNGASIASMLLSVDAMITDKEEEKKESNFYPQNGYPDDGLDY